MYNRKLYKHDENPLSLSLFSVVPTALKQVFCRLTDACIPQKLNLLTDCVAIYSLLILSLNPFLTSPPPPASPSLIETHYNHMVRGQMNI